MKVSWKGAHKIGPFKLQFNPKHCFILSGLGLNCLDAKRVSAERVYKLKFT